MIRKAIIVMLSLAAVGTSVLTALSFLWWPDVWQAKISANLEVLHAGGTWYINFAPASPPDLPKNVIIARGKLTLYHVAVTESQLAPEDSSPRWGFEFGGFCVKDTIAKRSMGSTPRPYRRLRKIQIPLLPACILFAAYPTILFIRGPVRRYRRRRKGLCLKCGYNLTGNVSGVCPECGGPIGDD